VDVSALEAVLAHRPLEVADTGHAGERVDPGEADDAIRRRRDQAGDVLVLDVHGHRPPAVGRLLERRHDRLDLEAACGRRTLTVKGFMFPVRPTLAHHEIDLVVEEDLANPALVEGCTSGRSPRFRRWLQCPSHSSSISRRPRG
jgi:hypothetical protein